MNSLAHSIRTRLPSHRDILLAFGAVSFPVFSWSIRGFFYKLPAFTLYFGLGANVAILCYMMAFALLESLLVTGLLVTLGVILPSRWLQSGFAYKCFLIVLVAAAAMILFEGYYKVAFLKDILAGQSYPVPPFIAGTAGAMLALGALFWLFRRKPQLQRLALDVLDRLSLFTYIYVPLGIIGLVVVLTRNLL